MVLSLSSQDIDELDELELPIVGPKKESPQQPRLKPPNRRVKSASRKKEVKLERNNSKKVRSWNKESDNS